jgi:LacI family transcriptional regulator
MTSPLKAWDDHAAQVGVVVDPNHAIAHRLLERFEELRWRLIDLNAFGHQWSDQMKFDGALLNCLPTTEVAQRLLRQGVPSVRLGSFPHPDDRRMPAVIPDWLATGRLAADHFAERGFRHLGFLGRDPWRDYRPLYDGLAERAAELGCQCHLLSLEDRTGQPKRPAGSNAMEVQKSRLQAWWKTVPRPLGMLATADQPAHRYVQWAIECGLRVPEDMAILGVGNQAFVCEGAVVPLSSIDPGQERLIDHAVDCLRRLMANQSLEEPTIRIAPRAVVTRRSTDVLASSDPDVVAALRFMWDHITEDLSVDQIVASVNVSRRKLERAFTQQLGRGIAEEYRRRRLEAACTLLIDTDLRIGEIADTLSFNSDHQLFRVFRAAYGMTPAQYRKQLRAEG